MAQAICGLQTNKSVIAGGDKLKDKKYFIAVKILFYGILIINLLLIFISVNRSSMAVLISSQFTFIVFICIAWVLIKRVFSVFLQTCLS